MLSDDVSARVRELITRSNLSNADFAAQVGLDGPKLSKSLSGDRRFTSVNLARIAQFGNTTVDWILGRDDETPALAARHDSGGVTSEEETQAAIEKATAWAKVRADLKRLGYPQAECAFQPGDRGRSQITDGEKLAADAVSYLRSQSIDHTSDRHLIDIVEDCFGVDVAVVPAGSKFEGLTWIDGSCRLIVIGTSSVPGRRRFTLAHELAHLLAGDDQKLTLDKVGGKRDPSEVRANTFAACFLMPENVIRERLSTGSVCEDQFAALSCELFVTPTTLAWRLFNLKMIDEQKRRRLSQLTAMDAAVSAGQTAEFSSWIKNSLTPRLPRKLVEDAGRAYLDGRTTLRPFANLVGVDAKELRSALEADRSELDAELGDEKAYVVA